LDNELNQVIFFIEPSVEAMKLISHIILNHSRQHQKKKYLIVFTPRRTNICLQLLEQGGVLGNIEIKDFDFDLFPLEKDLLSLEINEEFNEIYIE
jgi:hypothetical protein